MRRHAYQRAENPAAAVVAVTADPRARFLAGGSNLVDHLKLGIVDVDLLVDVSRLPLDTVERRDDGSLSIGATVRNSDLAAHPAVREGHPAVARALLAGASGQIRHQATTAGNLLQRTRCAYFQDPTTPCNKREPGTGCSALEGYGRYDAVLGASEACVAVHPSDLAVALVASDAVIVVLGADGERRVPIGDLHRLPGHHPDQDTTLQHGELITAVELPPPSALSRTGTYAKVRDRASYAFALVSVAAALELEDGVVRDVRVAWGGVAHAPWRARRLEERLRGGPLDEQAVRDALDDELRDAETTEQTAYKPPMLAGVTTRTLLGLAEEGRR